MNNDCLKLTTYFGERHRTDDQFVADALLDLYGRREIEVSVMLRGAEGFGLKHHLRTDRLLTLSEDLPLVAVAVDTRARIENLLDEVISIKRHGLIHARAGAHADRRDRGGRPSRGTARGDEAHDLRRASGADLAALRRSSRCATCFTAAELPARQSSSAWTARHTGCGSGRGSSRATPRCRR